MSSIPLSKPLDHHPKNILLVLLHNINELSLNCDFFKFIFTPYGNVKKVYLFL